VSWASSHSSSMRCWPGRPAGSSRRAWSLAYLFLGGYLLSPFYNFLIVALVAWHRPNDTPANPESAPRPGLSLHPTRYRTACGRHRLTGSIGSPVIGALPRFCSWGPDAVCAHFGLREGDWQRSLGVERFVIYDSSPAIVGGLVMMTTGAPSQRPTVDFV